EGTARICGERDQAIVKGRFAYLKVSGTPGTDRCAPLWDGCHFGRGGSRNSASLTPRPFAASVHHFLLCCNCHHFLVWWDRAGSARAFTLLFGAARSFRSHQHHCAFFGILSSPLWNIWRGRELVQSFAAAGRTITDRGSRPT